MIERLETWAIHAYADGELDAAERAAVETLLASDPEAQRVLNAIQRQKSALHAVYDGVLSENLPRSLAATVSGRGTRRFGPLAAAAASLVILSLGAALGWFVALETGSTLATDIGRRAIVAHEVYAVDVKHAVEVPASEAPHIKAWLGKRIGTPITIPTLEAAGFTFIGGRLLAAEDRPAGQLMYEDAYRKRLSIFLASNPTGKEDSIHVREKDNLISCYWAETDLAMAITGELPREQMMKIAEQVYDELEKE